VPLEQARSAWLLPTSQRNAMIASRSAANTGIDEPGDEGWGEGAREGP
jgi:hypothetical protein